jgi:hypothetical protein
MMIVILLAVGFMLFAFFLFSLRVLFVKGGEFRGTCASRNALLEGEGAVCGVCGRKPGEACQSSVDGTQSAAGAAPERMKKRGTGRAAE